MATGNMHTNLVKFSRAVFELNPSRQKHKHTDRQTNILIAILRNRGEVKITGQEVP